MQKNMLATIGRRCSSLTYSLRFVVTAGCKVRSRCDEVRPGDLRVRMRYYRRKLCAGAQWSADSRLFHLFWRSQPRLDPGRDDQPGNSARNDLCRNPVQLSGLRGAKLLYLLYRPLRATWRRPKATPRTTRDLAPQAQQEVDRNCSSYFAGW